MILTLVPKTGLATRNTRNFNFFCRQTEKYTGQKQYAHDLSIQGHKKYLEERKTRDCKTLTTPDC